MDGGGWQGIGPMVGQVLLSLRVSGSSNGVGEMIGPSHKEKDPISGLLAQEGIN